IFAGLVGWVAAGAIALAAPPEPAVAPEQPVAAGAARSTSVLTPAVLTLTVFFLLLSLSTGGINNFSVAALSDGYGVPFATANMALPAFLGSTALGVLAGGYLADRTRRHGDVAAASFSVAAVLVLTIATVPL